MRGLVWTIVLAGTAAAATLEKLSVDQMAAKATEVVRARVGACSADLRGRIVFTTCTLEVIERWKGPARPTATVSLPGGAAGGLRQSFPGTPVLTAGKEQVFFLWTGPSGRTHLVGLSQGLLALERGPAGEIQAVRAPISDRLLDGQGNPVRDEGVRLGLAELRERVGKGSR
jgi:hypothetical protein